MKKIFLFLLIVFFLSASFLFIFAQRELEVQYPTVPGTVTPTTVEGTQLPDYVKYIFNFAIIIAGVVAFGVIVWGGVRWLTSAGDPAKLKDAKEQVFAAFLGLIILFSSYLILTTINPQLVIFEVEELEEATAPSTPGVWLCKTAVDFESQEAEEQEKIKDQCLLLTTKMNLPSDFNNKVTNVYLASDQYGVILQEDENFKDDCQVFLASGEVAIAKPSSAIPFIKNSSPQGEIFLYGKEDFNEKEEGEMQGPFGVGRYDPGMDPVKSMKIDGDGPYVVALGKENFQGGCEVFAESHRSLIEYEIGKFCGIFSRRPCIKSMQVIGGVIY